MSKILIVGQFFASMENGKVFFPGGTERYIFGLAKQLQNDGYEVMILTVITNKDEAGISILDGLKIYRFKISDKRYGYCADFLSFINTLKFIRRFNPNIVHAISTRYRFAAGAITAAKIMKVKTVYTRTNLPNRKDRKQMWVLIDDFIFTKIIKQSDIIISLSKEMKDILEQEIHRKSIDLIPSFIMRSYFRKIEKDDKRILFVGRLDKLKGIEFLIESLSYVKNEIPEVKLSIAGNGDFLPHLKKLVFMYGLGDKITFEGHLGEDAIADMYSKSEIFVFPSLMEGMPMVLLEAMSSGLPVIAFDIGPCVEALDGGKYGVLVKKGDIKDLSQKIIEILKNKEKRAYYSKMAMERSNV